MSRESDKIIEVAGRFVGLYETSANAAWDNPDTPGADPEAEELKRLLGEVGWQPGWAYCTAASAAIWLQAYRELSAPASILLEIRQKFNPSTISSLANWSDRIVRVPVPGAVFFMQKGQTAQGHSGIVVRPAETSFATIEGNTSPDPASAEADREGDGFFRRTRRLNFTPGPGLYLRGFLHPLEIPA